MEEEKQKIFEFALDKFLKEGFYKITMDDLASQLRMSKKTIYKYFPSKDELVKETIFDFLSSRADQIKAIVDSDENAVNKFFNLVEFLGNMIIKFSDKWISDIQLYTPELWKEIDKFRVKMMYANLMKIIRQGIDEGYFIDKPEEIVVTIFVSSLRGTVNPDFILNNKFSLSESLETTLEILMKGIMTDKGKKIFSRLKAEKINE
ncbi:MAG TPA: TetR/AcrR family transcriptional regulator [Ignavibacteriaceae bacterium]|nr:TetR/AcrR family transcriptional regulator [Ignavibacteriaceae bacterium]